MSYAHLALCLFLLCIDTAQAWWAPPLPVGTQHTWVLRESESRHLVAERHDWPSGQVKRFELDIDSRDRDEPIPHAIAATTDGLWLAGYSLTLLRPDGKQHRFMLALQEPAKLYRLVALADDSLLLFDTRDTAAGLCLRLRWKQDGGLIVREITAPAFSYAASATRLADGRVLVVSQASAWLFDPSTNQWAASGRLSVDRNHPALAALADGRAFVAGSHGVSGSANQDRLRKAYGAEIWDPASGSWRALPTMPMSFNINAHHAKGPSASVLPDGSLVVGGGMHQRLLVLRAQGKGFASHWQVSEPLQKQRVSGIVQAITANEVVVADGLNKTPSGCCHWNKDLERLGLPKVGETRRHSLGLSRRDAAIAQRGNLSFVAGGWEAFSLSTTTTQASAVAELVDHRSGSVRDLPPLPFPLLTGQAMWLDGDRVLVKAIAYRDGDQTPIRHMDERSLEADSSGFLGIYNLQNNAWQTLSDPRIERARLAGDGKGRAMLIGDDASVWSIKLARLTLEELPTARQERQGGSQRILADGRLILAGGKTPSQQIYALDAGCHAAHCETQLFFYGQFSNANKHESLSLATGQWTLSATSSGAASNALIRADGRVVSLGLATEQWLIEQSDSVGTSWRELPFPAGFEEKSCAYEEDPACDLLLGALPASDEETVFLVRARWQSTQHLYDIWAFNDAAGTWHELARDLTEQMLLNKKVPVREIGGKTLFATGFAPQLLRLSFD